MRDEGEDMERERDEGEEIVMVVVGGRERPGGRDMPDMMVGGERKRFSWGISSYTIEQLAENLPS